MIACENCNKDHDGSYGSGRFCSIKCSRGFSTKNKRKEINEKISKSLKGHPGWNKGVYGKCSEETLKKLSESSKKYWGSLNSEQKNKKFESLRNLAGKSKYKKCKICNDIKEILHFSRLCEECKDDFRVYKEKCSFLFNIYDYPDRFDIELIEKYGWYSPKNSKNANLNGVSRDHILSISDGYKKNIDPSIISHPANCMIMRHYENQKKWAKSNITYDELIEKIKRW